MEREKKALVWGAVFSWASGGPTKKLAPSVVFRGPLLGRRSFFVDRGWGRQLAHEKVFSLAPSPADEKHAFSSAAAPAHEKVSFPWVPMKKVTLFRGTFFRRPAHEKLTFSWVYAVFRGLLAHEKNLLPVV